MEATRDEVQRPSTGSDRISISGIPPTYGDPVNMAQNPQPVNDDANVNISYPSMTSNENRNSESSYPELAFDDVRTDLYGDMGLNVNAGPASRPFPDMNSMPSWSAFQDPEPFADHSTMSYSQTQSSIPHPTRDSYNTSITESFDYVPSMRVLSPLRSHHSDFAMWATQGPQEMQRARGSSYDSNMNMPNARPAFLTPSAINDSVLTDNLNSPINQYKFPVSNAPSHRSWKELCQTIITYITSVMCGLIKLDTHTIVGLSMLANGDRRDLDDGVIRMLGTEALMQLCSKDPLTSQQIKGLVQLSGYNEDHVKRCVADGGRQSLGSASPEPPKLGPLIRKRARAHSFTSANSAVRVKRRDVGKTKALPDTASSMVPTGLSEAAATVFATNPYFCASECTQEEKMANKSKPRDPDKPYACLNLCGKTFASSDYFGFERHHQASTPQHGWLCNIPAELKDQNGISVCTFCGEVNPSASHMADSHPKSVPCSSKLIKAVRNQKGERLFVRPDKFKKHVGGHRGTADDKFAHCCCFEVPGNFNPECGFCGLKFPSFPDKLFHITKQHFDCGESLATYQEPWIGIEGAASDGDDNDDDQDDHDGKGDGNGDDKDSDADGDTDGNLKKSDHMDGDDRERHNKDNADLGRSNKDHEWRENDNRRAANHGLHDNDGSRANQRNIHSAQFQGGSRFDSGERDDAKPRFARLDSGAQSNTVSSSWLLQMLTSHSVDHTVTTIPPKLYRRLRNSVSDSDSLTWSDEELKFDICDWSNFETYALLGYGATSVVDKVRLSNDEPYYALKQQRLDRESLIKIHKEIQLLSRVHHRHISRMEGLAFRDETCSLLLSPVAKTSLAALLRKRKSDLLSFNLIRKSGCVVQGVKKMHDQNFCHFDLKPANILVDDSNSFVITDFGASAFGSKPKLTTWTPKYAAPELHTNEPGSKAADIWSLGCIFVEICAYLESALTECDTKLTRLLRKSDFLIKDHVDTLQTLLESRSLPSHYLSTSQSQMIQRMLRVDPLLRPSIDEVVNVFQPDDCCQDVFDDPKGRSISHRSKSVTEIFKYTPLERPKNQIRLISIDTQSSNNIFCTVSAFDLDDCPPYRALSYAWGSEENLKDIQLNCRSFSVRSNLYAFLQSHQASKQDLFWIDAICIDQSNLSEKSQQIQIMNKIFTKADQVLIWLGDATVAQTRAVHSLRRTVEDPQVFKSLQLSNSGVVKSWNPLLELFERPYWTRIWVIQEIVLARNLSIRFGNETLDWTYVQWLVPYLKLTKTQNIVKVIEKLQMRLGTNDRQESRFYDLLLNARGLECTDPRDRVYGLLGLSSDIQLEPNYSLSVQGVYVQLTKALLLEGYHGIWAACGNVGHYSKLLPSWVPDFSVAAVSPFPTFNLSTHADKGSKFAAPSFLDGNVLKIFGFFVDAIEDTWSPNHDLVAEIASIMESKRRTTHIFLCGGFGHSKYLQDRLKHSRSQAIIQATNAGITPIRPNLPDDGAKKLSGTHSFLTPLNMQSDLHSLSPSDASIKRFEHQVFAVTQSGLWGLSPKQTQKGDVVVRFQGSGGYFVLRGSKHGRFRLLGHFVMEPISVDTITSCQEFSTFYIE